MPAQTAKKKGSKKVKVTVEAPQSGPTIDPSVDDGPNLFSGMGSMPGKQAPAPNPIPEQVALLAGALPSSSSVSSPISASGSTPGLSPADIATVQKASGTGNNLTSTSADPLLAQTNFMKAIWPYISSRMDKYQGNLNTLADLIDKRAANVGNVPPQYADLLKSGLGNEAQDLRAMGGANLMSIFAQPQMDAITQMVQSYRKQQEADLQNQMIIRNLQSQIAAGPASTATTPTSALASTIAGTAPITLTDPVTGQRIG